jgi:hypothetical protein
MSDIGDLAVSIWDTEFGDATGAAQRTSEISNISGWLGANVGMLNTVIYKSFSGNAEGNVLPSETFKLEEQDIYTQLYLKHFYDKKARNVLRGIDGSLNSDIDWIRLREGDSLIVRSNKTDVAKLYLSMAKDAAEELENLVYSYNFYQAVPRQVAGNDGNYFVSGGRGYYG